MPRRLDVTVQNKKYFMYYLYTLPLENRTYRYAAKNLIDGNEEILRAKAKEYNIEDSFIHRVKTNKAINHDTFEKILYISSYLGFENVYINSMIKGKHEMIHKFDIIYNPVEKDLKNLIIQFPSYNNDKVINLNNNRESIRIDTIENILYVDDYDFSNPLTIQKLKYKICQMTNRKFSIYENEVKDTDILHTLKLYDAMKDSYRSYLYSSLLQNSIINSVKEELVFMESIYDKIPNSIMNYTNELHNCESKMTPLIKRINRRF